MHLRSHRFAFAVLLTAITGGRLAALHAQTAPVPPINADDRAAVLDAYQRYYMIAGTVPSGFTGNLTAGQAGTVSDDHQRATLVRINFNRALAGLNGDVVLDPTLNAKCQQAALMMAAQGQLSHDPDPSWKFYTAEGAEAANHSDLTVGVEGPAAVANYFTDAGDNNAIVGHRHWLLLAGQTVMGSGSVGTAGQNFGLAYEGLANAIWVVPTAGVPDRPANAPARIAWPSAGYFPAALTPVRWSVWEADTDFSAAVVRVSRNGMDLGAVPALAADRVWYWEDALIFSPALPTGAPSSLHDETYHVQITGMRRASTGTVVTYDYTVITANPGTVGDPAQTPQLPEVSLTASASVATPLTKTKIIFTRTGNTADRLSVTYLVGGTATSGIDYRSLSGVATIPAGMSSIRVKVKVLAGVRSGSTVKVQLTPADAYRKDANAKRVSIVFQQ